MAPASGCRLRSDRWRESGRLFTKRRNAALSVCLCIGPKAGFALFGPMHEIGYFPLILAFNSLAKASTLPFSITLPGTMMRPPAGMPDLSPSRYLAISFIPW